MAMVKADFLSNVAENGGVQFDLLWTLPDNKTTMDAETITLDLSDYDYIGLQTYSENSTTELYDNISVFPKGATDVVHFRPTFSSTNRYRKINSITDTGISFGLGYQNSTSYNWLLVPYKIWGIKNINVN